MSIEQRSNNVWTISRDFKVPGLGNIGGRMTIVRLQDKDLALISPVSLEEQDVQEIQKLGQVKYVIAPNSMHHLYLKKAHQKFPGSKVWGPPGLPSRRKDILFDWIINKAEWPFENTLAIHIVSARHPLNEELIFFHKEDRVLIVTDFVFNLQKVEGFLPKLLARWNRTYKRLGMSRIGRMAFTNNTAIQEALNVISDWKPEILVMAHGEVIKSHAFQKLIDSFKWLK